MKKKISCRSCVSRCRPHRIDRCCLWYTVFREAYPSALRKTAFLAHVLDINTPVLVFDWPGDQGSSLRGYRRARSVAQESGAELARTLELIIEEVRPERLVADRQQHGRPGGHCCLQPVAPAMPIFPIHRLKSKTSY